MPGPLPPATPVCWPLVVIPWAVCGLFWLTLPPLTYPPKWWLESWLELEPRLDSSPRGEPDRESLLYWCAGVFTVAACCTLWFSGWEATRVEELGSTGVAFTGATDAAAVVAAAGALAPAATFGLTEVPLDNDGLLANDGAGAEKVDADATGFAEPL
ncbi:MAG: hypothetical protein JO287_02960 [Pseudonocardiales bacterium]|nr:hypothetical protein [Pseudonocardiales bacterium]